MKNAFDCKELFHFGLIIAEGILKRRIVLLMKTTTAGVKKTLRQSVFFEA